MHNEIHSFVTLGSEIGEKINTAIGRFSPYNAQRNKHSRNYHRGFFRVESAVQLQPRRWRRGDGYRKGKIGKFYGARAGR